MVIGAMILGIGHIGIHAQHAKEVYGPRKKRNIFVRIIKWVVTVPVVLVIVLVIGFFAVTIASRNYKQIKRAIDYRNGVDENIYVELNGRQQYMWIAGRDTSNPVIISLHGGPGSPSTFCDYDYINYLTDDYTVVIWEETGCGRSYYANTDTMPDNEGLTVEMQEDDLDAIVDYLCDRFGQDQVIIMGHSYGSLLGSEYIADHPEKVSAYIGIGQLTCPFFETTTYSYEHALELATEAGDDTSVLEEAYAAYCENPESVDVDTLMTLRNAWGPYLVETVTTNVSTWDVITCPILGVDDINWYMLQLGALTGDSRFQDLEAALDEELNYYDLNAMGDVFTMPALLTSGSCDWVCPAELAEEKAALHDGVEYVPIEGCGHSPQGQVPEQVAEVIRHFLAQNV